MKTVNKKRKTNDTKRQKGVERKKADVRGRQDGKPNESVGCGWDGDAQVEGWRWRRRHACTSMVCTW
jgi:hypothetical protein